MMSVVQNLLHTLIILRVITRLGQNYKYYASHDFILWKPTHFGQHDVIKIRNHDHVQAGTVHQQSVLAEDKMP